MSWKWTPKMINCAECGAETLATHNKTKFCPDCAKRRDQESRLKETERKMQKRMEEKAEILDDREIHFCDSPENVQKCLNCKKPDCTNCLMYGTGSNRKLRRNFFPEEMKEKAVELYRSGLTQRKIAETLGVSNSTIFRWVSFMRSEGIL